MYIYLWYNNCKIIMIKDLKHLSKEILMEDQLLAGETAVFLSLWSRSFSLPSALEQIWNKHFGNPHLHRNQRLKLKIVLRSSYDYGWDKGKHTKKSVFFSVVGPLKGVGRVTLWPLSKKPLFSINGENSPGSCIMKILFYEVRHFSPNFHICLF